MEHGGRRKTQLTKETECLHLGGAELKKPQTQHKPAEEAPHFQSEVLASLPIAMAVVRVSDDTIVYANPRFEEMFGYNPGELIGKSPAVLNALANGESPEEIHREIVANLNKYGMWSGEIQNIRKDGTPFWCHASVSTLESPQYGRVWVGYHEDITERKRAEEELTRVIEGMAEAVVITDSNGKICQVNSEFERGSGWKREEVVGKTAIEAGFMSKDEHPKIEKEVLPKLMKEGFVRNIETMVTRRDGTKFPALMSWTLIKDAKGKPTNIVTIARDITERKRAEEALRESEHKYRALFESTLDGAFVIDAETMKVVLANQAAMKIYGFDSVKDAVGADPFDFIPLDDREQVSRTIVEDMFEKDLRQVNEFRTITKDGREIWISAVGVRTEYQGRLAGLVSFRDITEHKRAEEALQESEAKYSSLVEQAKDGVVILQGEIFKFANRAMAKLSGYTMEEILGMRWLDMMAPEYQDIAAQTYKSRVAGKKLPPVYESKIRCKDGTIKEVELSAATFQYQGRLATMGIVRDITERKRAEEARVEHAAALARAEELQQSRQRIVTMQESLRKDIAGQLHGAVQNRLIILLYRLTELEQAAPSEELAKELRHVQQQLRKLLEGQVRAITCRLYPSILRRGLVPALQFLGDQFETAVAIEMQLDKELMRQEKANHELILEQVRLAVYRIAEEALTNVVKHAKASKVMIGLGMPSKGWLRLKVRDNGQGFDVGSASGGLGMLMMRDYAGVMGGRCVIRSAPGEGAEVTATLPLAGLGAEHLERAPLFE